MVWIFLCVVMVAMVSQSDAHITRAKRSLFPEQRQTRRFEALLDQPNQRHVTIGSSGKKHPSHMMTEKSVPSNSRIIFIDDERQSATYNDSLGRYMNFSSSNPKPLVAHRKGKRQVSNDAKLVFPGPTKPRPEFSGTSLSDKFGSLDLVIPEECKQLGFCENVSHYPKERAAALLAELGDAAKYLTNDELGEETAIAQRQGGAEQERNLCQSDERIASPDMLPDRSGKWYYILRDQRIRVEICDNASSSCKEDIVVFQHRHKGTCLQKYSYRLLVAIDKHGNLVSNTTFKVPSCCSCVGITW